MDTASQLELAPAESFVDKAVRMMKNSVFSNTRKMKNRAKTLCGKCGHLTVIVFICLLIKEGAMTLLYKRKKKH